MGESPCPVILLTSHTDQETVEGAKGSGVMAFLVKPLRPEELGPTLALAVSRFEEFQAIREENAGLKKSLESRKVIERAKGLLMERDGLSEPEAFRRIRKLSMDKRKSMAEIAEALLLIEERPGGGSPKARNQ
jgi:response regulator NasT